MKLGTGRRGARGRCERVIRTESVSVLGTVGGFCVTAEASEI